MSRYAFVSYSRQDRGYVESLASHLTDAGVQLWFDYEVVTGDRFEQVIRDKIDNCGAFILVMTPTSEESDWVSREITRARDKDRPIFPLLLAGDPHFSVNNRDYVDVRNGSMPSPEFTRRLAGLLGTATGGASDRPAISSVDVPEFLAKHRPPEVKSFTVDVLPHLHGDALHELLVAAVLSEALTSWPDGTTFILDYASSYAQGIAHPPRLLTEIGEVDDSGLRRATQFGWIDPSNPPEDDGAPQSRRLWRDNPVREWDNRADRVAQISSFLTQSVLKVLREDPGAGFTLTFFNNFIEEQAADPAAG